MCQVRYSNGKPLPLRRPVISTAMKTRSSPKSVICSISMWTPSSTFSHISSIHSRTPARPRYKSPIPRTPSRASHTTSGLRKASKASESPRLRASMAFRASATFSSDIAHAVSRRPRGRVPTESCPFIGPAASGLLRQPGGFQGSLGVVGGARSPRRVLRAPAWREMSGRVPGSGPAKAHHSLGHLASTVTCSG